MSDQPSVSPKDLLFPEPTFSDSINEFTEALSAAQGGMTSAATGAYNPHFKRDYADLADVWDVCRGPLAANHLAVAQLPYNRMISGSVYHMLRTRIAHKSGQWMQTDVGVKAGDNPQVLGSVITYLRRYSLSAMVGIAPRGEDDDAEGAEGRAAPPIARPQGAKPAGATSAPKAAAPAASPPNGSAPAPAAVPVPEAAKAFVDRFDKMTDPAEFHKAVESTRGIFDDGTPEKKALSAAITRAAARMGIQPKKKDAPAPAPSAA